jgi:hypothetical protein
MIGCIVGSGLGLLVELFQIPSDPIAARRMWSTWIRHGNLGKDWAMIGLAPGSIFVDIAMLFLHSFKNMVSSIR